MRTPFDLLALFIIVLTQREMRRQFLAAAARRVSNRQLRLLRWSTVAFFVVISVCFTASFSYMVARYAVPARPAELAGAVGQIWLFASTAGYLAHRAFRLLPFDPARRKALNTTSAVLVAAPFAITGYGTFVERLDFHVRQVDVPVPNLPESLNGLRLVQVSDIHLSAFLSESDLARVIDSANELRPHLALVTGDLITANGDPLDVCLRQLSRLRADAGILGCMGNHETYALAEKYAEQQGERLGVRFLRGRAQTLRFGDATINVAGVDYQRKSAAYLLGAERLVQPGMYNLLLSHNPDVFPVAADKGFDLTLSGHTHGGQVNVEILHQDVNPARFFTPYVYGFYQRGAASAYVTRGIGTIGVPARIGAQPEIALLRLRKA